jgi:hypothetical protein
MIRGAFPGMRRAGWTAALVAALAATPAAAQTPYTAIGLGYPITPLDGRAAALGGTGIGLLGSSFSLVNPAEMTRHTSPAFAISFSGEGVDVEGGDAPLDTGRQRFNMIRAVAPLRGFVVGLAFGGVFDQDWTARFDDTLSLADGSVPFEETREHDGGVSTIELSLARSFGPVSVGLSGQRFTGSLRQSFSRTFDLPLGEAPSLGRAGGSQTLSYSGWRFRGGASIDWDQRFMVSGAISLPTTLTATPKEEGAASADVDMPLTLELGASVVVVPRLLAGASVGYAEWSAAGGLGDVSAHDILRFGGGLEYRGLSLFGGALPVRVGIRRGQLPFSYGEDPVDEQAFTGGFGWVFRQGVAEVNLGFEAGTRGDLELDGAEESFRRLTVSFALRQFRPF